MCSCPHIMTLRHTEHADFMFEYFFCHLIITYTTPYCILIKCTALLQEIPDWIPQFCPHLPHHAYNAFKCSLLWQHTRFWNGFSLQYTEALDSFQSLLCFQYRQGNKYMSAQAQGLYWMRPCSVCLEGAALECGS